VIQKPNGMPVRARVVRKALVERVLSGVKRERPPQMKVPKVIEASGKRMSQLRVLVKPGMRVPMVARMRVSMR